MELTLEESIQRLAAGMAGKVIGFKRGKSETVQYKLADDAPEWMSGIVKEVHDAEDAFPNDWIYRFIAYALEALTIAESYGLLDSATLAIEGYCPVYTEELIEYIGGRGLEKCQGAIDSGVTNLFDAMTQAWCEDALTVMLNLVSALEDYLTN